MKKVGNKFICPIHLNILEDPIWLDCLHAVCRKCLISQLKQNVTSCPVCDFETHYTLQELENTSIQTRNSLVQSSQSSSMSLVNQKKMDNSICVIDTRSIQLLESSQIVPYSFVKQKKEYADEIIKISLIGYLSVGKTSLVRCLSGYKCLATKPTIEVDIVPYEVEVDNKIYKITIWDTSGQERFNFVQKNHYRGSYGTAFIYDATDKESFDSLSRWMKLVKETCHNSINLIIGNKIDLVTERCVPKREGERFASQTNAIFYETSALTGENVKEAFEFLVRKIANRITEYQQDETIRLGGQPDSQKKESTCC